MARFACKLEAALPEYARLFREAVRESQRDYYCLHRELMIAGFWRLRLRKRSPLIPARTYFTYSEPGNEENVLDRWPLPYLVGEICGQLADALDIFGAPERRPLRPLKLGDTYLSEEEHYHFLVADAQHAAAYRPDDPLSKPLQRIDLTRAPPLF